MIQGVSKGQTQIDLSEYGDFASFSHPLDIHLVTKTIQGQLVITVKWKLFQELSCSSKVLSIEFLCFLRLCIWLVVDNSYGSNEEFTQNVA